jgi:hypothetical protein
MSFLRKPFGKLTALSRFDKLTTLSRSKGLSKGQESMKYWIPGQARNDKSPFLPRTPISPACPPSQNP